jgi:DNA helicase-2/ATP-dependent DNA helicase PcrA
VVTPLRVGRAVAAADPTDTATPIAPDQRAVVEAEAPALRVTAPAGSGKTRTMVEWAVSRAARLAEAPGGLAGRSVLAVSFTNRATAELQARIGAALRAASLPVDAVRVATFHAFAAAVVTEFGHHFGLARDPVLLGAAEQHRLVEEALEHVVFETMDATWLPTAVKGIAELASQLADHQVSVETAEAWHRLQLEDYRKRADEVARLRLKKDRELCETASTTVAERLDLLGAVRAFRARKAEVGALDHADQLEQAVHLLDLPAVADALRGRHPYLVVDEYQDTNVAQRELLQRLHDPIAGQLVVVGDDAQAIYRFRGATLDNFRSFADHFAGADARTLERVYRHGPEVVALAEAVVRRSTGWVDRTTVPSGPPSSSVRIASFPDQAREVEAVAEHVRRLVRDEGVPCREVAVLAPQRRLLLPVARRLEQLGVPVEAPGLGNLLDSPTFHEVLAVLRLAHDPGDAMAAARVLRGPRYRLGPAELVSFVEAAEATASRERRAAGLGWRDDVGVRLLDGLLQPDAAVSPQVAARVAGFLDDVRRWAAAAPVVPLGELVTMAADDLGVGEALATSPSPLAVRARSELVATVDAAEEYEAMSRGAGLAGFLAMVDRMLDEDEDVEVAPPDPLSPAVRLLTIHSAKGLEFGHVVITGAFDSALPNVRATGCEVTRSGRSSVPDDLRRDGDRASPPLWDHTAVAAHVAAHRAESSDEQRRLFYVAATRARTSVLVTSSTWVWGAGGAPRRTATKSTYLAELRAAGFDVEEVGGPAPAANPLEPLVLFDPPEPIEVGPLERALVDGAPLPVSAPAVAERVARVEAVARRLRDRAAADRRVAPAPPREHTVTDLVLAARCPVAYARERVLGLPRAPSDAARRGTLVHRWLEERSWALQEGADPALVPRPWQPAALLPLLPADGTRRRRPTIDPDAGAEAALDDPAEPVGSDTEADRLADRFLASPYAGQVPEAVELPLVLTVGGAYVRGTADLVFGDGPDEGAPWEVVDLKTGPAPTDEAGWLQLEAYALAVADGGRDLGTATLTFLSLAGRRAAAVSRPARPRDEIVASLRAALEATAGPYTCEGCRWCR